MQRLADDNDETFTDTEDKITEQDEESDGSIHSGKGLHKCGKKNGHMKKVEDEGSEMSNESFESVDLTEEEEKSSDSDGHNVKIKKMTAQDRQNFGQINFKKMGFGEEDDDSEEVENYKI